jgi:hypothetical protein
MPNVEVKGIAVWRFAVILAILEAVVGLLSGIMMATGTFAPPALAFFLQFIAPSILPLQSSGILSVFSLLIGPNLLNVPSVVVTAVALPIAGFLLGLVQGMILTGLYNLVAGRLGGLVFAMNLSFLEPSTKPSIEEQGKVQEK